MRLEEVPTVGQHGPREFMLACVEFFIQVLLLNEKIEGEAEQTLVLFGVRCGRRTEKRNPQDISLTGEPVLGLGQYGHTVSVFTEICVLHEYNRVNKIGRASCRERV